MKNLWKESQKKGQTTLDLVSSTNLKQTKPKTNENPLKSASFDGDGVLSVSGETKNPPPHHLDRETYRLQHMDIPEAEFDKIWQNVEVNRKKAERCGK